MPTLDNIGYDHALHEAMIEEIGRRNLSTLPEIITALTVGYLDLYDLDHASVINSGMCEDFAIDIRYLFPDCLIAWDDEISDDGREGSHCVIIYEAQYYDCECAEGSVILDDLPYFQRIAELIQMLDPADDTPYGESE